MLRGQFYRVLSGLLDVKRTPAHTKKNAVNDFPLWLASTTTIIINIVIIVAIAIALSQQRVIYERINGV